MVIVSQKLDIQQDWITREMHELLKWCTLRELESTELQVDVPGREKMDFETFVKIVAIVVFLLAMSPGVVVGFTRN